MTIHRYLVLMPTMGLLLASSADAQQPPADPKPVRAEGQPVPKQPLVPRAPVRAEWTVRMSTEFSESWEDVPEMEHAAAALSEMRTVRSITFSKDANVRTFHLLTRWSDGESEDEWIVMGNHVAERPGGRGYYVVGSEATVAQDLEKTDFPELAWLEMSHFRGIKTHKGKPVFVFTVPFDDKALTGDQARLMDAARQSDPSATPSDVFRPKTHDVVVYLDAATQLPVLYNDGMLLRQYDFKSTPTTGLRPPADILKFLRSRHDALRARLAAPAGPGG